MSFQLHPRLAADTHNVGDLPLCRLLLHRDARFPWLILVPRQPDLREVHDLAPPDQTRLWREAGDTGAGLLHALNGDKLNLATLGNQVSQLHVHVIVRFETDAAWPGPVWGVGAPRTYDDAQLAHMLARVRQVMPVPD